MNAEEILARSREALAKWCERDDDAEGAAKYRSGRGDDSWDMEILGIALGEIHKPLGEIVTGDPDTVEAIALVASRWPQGCCAAGQPSVVDHCLAAIKRGRALERADTLLASMKDPDNG